ncbi:hypothetical protein [Lentzea aerocolonigenes]|uniref:hypothetical protein n=1 Tax=Lentzea aerocolonigenes TaxID=68170 RepID=UPI0004C2F121|nr:hypothetical protein [Lentzea aerocolonigenes]MCP2249299.1 hypothetical protein [Lentzea aerocolonigenes]
MALAERQQSFHRTVIDVVYKTMDQLARTDSPDEVFELREQLRAALPWWRGLLKMHEPNEKHRCRSCRAWYGRHRAWPCPVWRDAVQALHQLNDMYGFLAHPVSADGRPGERVTVTWPQTGTSRS